MHPELNSRMKLLSTCLSLALLSSCASAPGPYSADVEARDIVVEDPVTVGNQGVDDPKTPFENRFDDEALVVEELKSNRAKFYTEQAQAQTDPDARIDASLSAAEYYIQASNYVAAADTIEPLNAALLKPVQTDRLAVINGYIAYSRGQHRLALQTLEPLTLLALSTDQFPTEKTEASSEQASGGLSSELETASLPQVPDRIQLSTQQVDALLLSSFSHQALGDFDSAVAALIAREGSLVGAARSETTRYIWQLISALPMEQRQEIFQNSQNALVRNRFEQSLNAERAQVALAPQQFNRWQELPSEQTKQSLESNWTANSPRSIAILLPITSKFESAANALKDGIEYQHASNQSPFRPQLRFYDIGDNPNLASQYYASAVQSGADFIIGPLGKDYANQISRYSYDAYGGNSSSAYQSRPSTLLLGGDTPLNASTSRFTMSPEMEGARIAEKAWKDGHLSAGLLVTDSLSSQRTVAAFTQKWQSLGGKISKTVSYSPAQFDHTTELKQLFAVNQSEYRHSAISRTLGFKPKFTAYQRADIDFVLMIANTKTGRLVRPQVNFFSGSKVPVYATSDIFDGRQDKIENFDLNNTRFPVMPWVMQSTQIAKYAGRLNMLFALGADSYSVAANFEQLRQNKQLAINGKTGQVSISTSGETVYQPVWATFTNGEVVAQETLGLDINPLSAPNGATINTRNVNGTYSDSTYNSQTWDKSSGSRRQSPQRQYHQQQAPENNQQQEDSEDGLRGSR